MNRHNRRVAKWLRPYLPNKSTRLSLVSLDDEHPFRAHWPIRLTQIVGGKTWSISFTRLQTPGPIPTTPLPSPESSAS